MEGNENAGNNTQAMRTYRFKKPHSTLQDIMYEKLSLMLLASKSMGKFHSNKQCVKDFCSQMPQTVRSSLLEKALSTVDESRETTDEIPESVYITQVLFQKGSKKLDLQYLQSTFVVEILLHVEQYGANLEIFKLRIKENLAFPTNIYQNYIKRMLNTARNLVVLELPQFCSDEVLRSIGENCPRLETLDATRSQITDKGLHYLTQNLVKVPEQTNGPVLDWASSLFGIPGVLMPLQELVPPGESIESYERRKSPLCQTLRTMKCSAGCGITDKGLLVALRLLPNLGSFGCWTLDSLLLRLEASVQIHQLPSFKLTIVCLSKLTKNFLNFVITVCPNIQILHICTPLVYIPVTFFNEFASLYELYLEDILMFQMDESAIQQSTPFRNRLKSLTFDKGNYPCNLCAILNFFPSLTSLTVNMQMIIWNQNELLHIMTEHQNISYINLCVNIGAEILFTLLKFAVNLEEIRVKNIVQRPQNYLERLCTISDSPKLKIFVVYGAAFLTTKEDLMFFLCHFKHIMMVGKLPFRL